MRTVFVLALIATCLMPACTRQPEAPAAPSQEAAPSTQPTVVDNPPAPAAPRLRVIGTEPFWGIDVDGSRLHFTTMEDQAGRHLEAKALADGAGWRWSGSEARGDYVLDIQPGECSDGMSDRRYAYTASFNIEGTHYRGCADAPAKFSGEGQQP